MVLKENLGLQVPKIPGRELRQGKGSREAVERARACPVELNPKPGYWPGNQHTRRKAELGDLGAEPGATDPLPFPAGAGLSQSQQLGGVKKGVLLAHSFIF